MITIKDTTIIDGTDTVNNVVTMHPAMFVLNCEDYAGNAFEVETNKETYVQVTNFLDTLKQV